MDTNALKQQSAAKVIGWAVNRFHPRLVLTTSMTDAVLIDVAVRVEPALEVVFIDTGFHFPETLETLERVRLHYGLNLTVVTAPPDLRTACPIGTEQCCSDLKVRLLERALAGKLAWLTGLRRADSASRASAPVVSRDRRGLVKLNPLATWTDADVARYIADHDVPVNPLVSRGYPSIGCWPCTRPVATGEHARAGRWPGRAKTECGLHV